MAATLSTSPEISPLALGANAPYFELPALDGPLVRLTDFETAPALLVAFMSNACAHSRHVERALGRMCEDFSQAVLATVAICSTDATTQPEDNVDGLVDQATRGNFLFPYLIDETQEIAKAYGAVYTPDFFLFDGDRKLVYRGQIDESRPDNDTKSNAAVLREVVEHLIWEEPISPAQQPSEGAPILWRSANTADQAGESAADVTASGKA